MNFFLVALFVAAPVFACVCGEPGCNRNLCRPQGPLCPLPYTTCARTGSLPGGFGMSTETYVACDWNSDCSGDQICGGSYDQGGWLGVCAFKASRYQNTLIDYKRGTKNLVNQDKEPWHREGKELPSTSCDSNCCAEWGCSCAGFCKAFNSVRGVTWGSAENNLLAKAWWTSQECDKHPNSGPVGAAAAGSFNCKTGYYVAGVGPVKRVSTLEDCKKTMAGKTFIYYTKGAGTHWDDYCQETRGKARKVKNDGWNYCTPAAEAQVGDYAADYSETAIGMDEERMCKEYCPTVPREDGQRSHCVQHWCNSETAIGRAAYEDHMCKDYCPTVPREDGKRSHCLQHWCASDASALAAAHEAQNSSHPVIHVFAGIGLAFLLYGSFKHYTKA